MAETRTPAPDPFPSVLEELAVERERSLDGARQREILFTTLVEREAVRAAKELGPADARSRQLMDVVGASRDRLAALTVERDRIGVRVPDIGIRDALVHGRIIDEDGFGIRGLEVALTQRRGTIVDAVPQSTTATNGYYALQVPGDVLVRRVKAGISLTVSTKSGRILQKAAVTETLAAGSLVGLDVRIERKALVVDYEKPYHYRPKPTSRSPGSKQR
jgi:hypothetical protein